MITTGVNADSLYSKEIILVHLYTLLGSKCLRNQMYLMDRKEECSNFEEVGHRQLRKILLNKEELHAENFSNKLVLQDAVNIINHYTVCGPSIMVTSDRNMLISTQRLLFTKC